MTLQRRLALVSAALAGAALLAQPALAARPTTLPFTLGSTHFLVHYESDTTQPDAITETTAGDVAAYAERALTAELADGYPAPLPDGALGGDGRIDIYVGDLDPTGKLLGVAVPDTGALQDSGFILLNGDTPDALTQHSIAHELFHLIQFGLWTSASVPDFWLYEATAEWMGFRVDSYGAGNGFELGPPGMALDCRDPLGTNKCDLGDSYSNDGYSRWTFFEYLTETYGPSFVKDVFAQGGSGTVTALQALTAALAAKGATLADAYNAWTAFDLQGRYSVSSLQEIAPTPFTTVQVGTSSGTVANTKVAVDHLATRYVEFDRGDGDTTKPCFAATLTLTVTIPAGTSSQPVFRWDAKGSSAVPLTVDGSTATASVPWDTCTWSSGAGFLALPNASTNVDAADFGVTATLAVDPTTPAAAAPPPPEASIYGTVVPVTTTEAAPVLTAYGTQVVQLDAATGTVRLVVQASAEGTLHAVVGTLDLGTAPLRPGNNTVSFAVPKAVRGALRTTTTNRLLMLTPFSPQGHVMGAPLERRLTVPAPARARVAAKHHAKHLRRKKHARK